MFTELVTFFIFNINSYFYFLNWTFFFQFIILYVLYNIYAVSMVYYTIIYLFLQILICGVVLVFYQMDLFTAFLFLSESVIIFISILLMFYLNVYGNFNYNIKSYYFLKISGFCFLIFFNIFYIFYSESDFFINFNFNSIIFYENFYENLDIYNLNDMYGIFINFFYLNSLSYVLIGLLLLVGSLVCVNINISNKFDKILNYNDLFLVIDFFKDFSKFFFMRKQNLVDQLNSFSASRSFEKKTKTITAKKKKKDKEEAEEAELKAKLEEKNKSNFDQIDKVV